MAVLARLLLAAASIRICYIVVLLTLSQLLNDYDTSSTLTSSNCAANWPLQQPQQSRQDAASQSLLVWDFLFMHRIAACGYEYEQFYAFFPAVPGLASWSFAVGIPAAYWMIAFNFLAMLVSVACLYRVTLTILGCDQQLAVLSCLLFALNPASIHHAMPYSEAGFTAATFIGLYCLYCLKQPLPAAVAFALSTAARSNGLLNAGYLLHEAARQILQCWPSRKLQAVRLLLQAAACTAVVASPYVLFQVQGYWAFCQSPVFEPRPWCAKKLPSIYGWVQEHYWNVGLFRYYKLQQVPNFLLAAPTLLLSMWGVVTYAAANKRHLLFGGLLPPPPTAGSQPLLQQEGTPSTTACGKSAAGKSDPRHKEQLLAQSPSVQQQQQHRYQLRPRSHAPTTPASTTRKAKLTQGGQQGEQQQQCDPLSAAPVRPAGALNWQAEAGGSSYLAPDAAVFMVHWGVMVVVCMTVVHIQVSTRLLSCGVPWYWFAAHLVQQGLQQCKETPSKPGRFCSTTPEGPEPPNSCTGPLGQPSQTSQTPQPHARSTTVAPQLLCVGEGLLGKEGGHRIGGRWAPLLWGYCGVMMAAGAVLFPNFYPWT